MRVIVPLVKDAKAPRRMNNIRPISLQPCLGKILNRILAYRLSIIFAQHPILNRAQRGFINGGTTIKCIDELLDAWDWSRINNKESYTLFYDIKQAYDSVQTDVLVRSLELIHLPSSFVHFIHDSLTGLQSCVRTIYGDTTSFPVRRSIRQGDPLAPLLFVILMDALHDGLETNPFDHKQHGCTLTSPNRGHPASVYLPSLGYADDTATLTNSLHDLSIQHTWVMYFLSFNRMRLNPAKCELVGRKSDGTSVTANDIRLHQLAVDGVDLIALDHNKSIRYLGLNIRFDGLWNNQIIKSYNMIGLFTRMIHKFAPPIAQAAYIYNVFLLPKLELALHYVHGTGTQNWLKKCDGMMVGAIKHAVSSPLRLSHTVIESLLRFFIVLLSVSQFRLCFRLYSHFDLLFVFPSFFSSLLLTSHRYLAIIVPT